MISWAFVQGTMAPVSSLHLRRMGEERGVEEALEARAADQISCGVCQLDGLWG